MNRILMCLSGFFSPGSQYLTHSVIHQVLMIAGGWRVKAGRTDTMILYPGAKATVRAALEFI